MPIIIAEITGISVSVLTDDPQWNYQFTVKKRKKTINLDRYRYQTGSLGMYRISGSAGLSGEYRTIRNPADVNPAIAGFRAIRKSDAIQQRFIGFE